MPDGVVFDLDGVLLDSEQRWNDAKEAVTTAAGGRWRDDAATAMMGMSSPEWSAYMQDELAVPYEPERINAPSSSAWRPATRRSCRSCRARSMPSKRCAARWPLGLASSSNREIIDAFLDLSGLRDRFRVTTSSEEVGRGKPSPDVYLEVAALLGADAAAMRRRRGLPRTACGLPAAAGMAVIAVPNPHYPPAPDALALAAATVMTPGEVTPALVERVADSPS